MTRNFRQFVFLPALPALVLSMALAAALLLAGEACSQQQLRGQSRRSEVLVGQGALGDWTTDAPGVRRRITTADMPPPYATRSVDAGSRVVKRPEGAWPQVPAGFKVEEFAAGLSNPRLIRTAPNGDLFVAESEPGRVRVLRGAAGKAEVSEIFAADLHQPFGIAFYPLGPDPRYVYVADTDAVLRFPYRNGDLKARGPAETIVPDLPGGGLLRGGRALDARPCLLARWQENVRLGRLADERLGEPFRERRATG